MTIQQFEELTKSIQKIESQIAQITKTQEQQQTIGGWISRETAMKFLGYRNTTMRELEKSGRLTFVTIGRKKFIKTESLIQLLEASASKK